MTGQERVADLHVHTTHSDSLYTPARVVAQAVARGLRAVAITDHDGVSGLIEVMRRVTHLGLDLEIIPGVELSTTVDGNELHILGYGIDYQHPLLLERLAVFQQARLERAQHMVKKLNQMGIKVDYEVIQSKADGAAIGRPHIAEVLVEQGTCRSFQDAFIQYIGYHAPAYVPKYALSPAEGIALVRQAGGVAVLAHPGTVRRDELIPQLVTAGLQGIEVIHPNHNDIQRQIYTRIARKQGLYMTGGSDCHGPRPGRPTVGQVTIPYDWVGQLNTTSDSEAGCENQPGFISEPLERKASRGKGRLPRPAKNDNQFSIIN